MSSTEEFNKTGVDRLERNNVPLFTTSGPGRLHAGLLHRRSITGPGLISKMPLSHYKEMVPLDREVLMAFEASTAAASATVSGAFRGFFAPS
jgi:hypothetical protein